MPQPDPPFTSPRWSDEHFAHHDHPATDAFDRLLHQVAELREYFSYWLSAKADGVKGSIRRIGLLAVLGVVALIAGITLTVMTVVLLLNGMADGLGRLFGGRQWLGELVTGVFFLIVLTWGLYLGWSRTTRSWRKATVAKYEQRKEQQRRQFGRDVRQQAAQTRP